jgi:hypothetical protein
LEIFGFSPQRNSAENLVRSAKNVPGSRRSSSKFDDTSTLSGNQNWVAPHVVLGPRDLAIQSQSETDLLTSDQDLKYPPRGTNSSTNFDLELIQHLFNTARRDFEACAYVNAEASLGKVLQLLENASNDAPNDWRDKTLQMFATSLYKQRKWEQAETLLTSRGYRTLLSPSLLGISSCLDLVLT